MRRLPNHQKRHLEETGMGRAGQNPNASAAERPRSETAPMNASIANPDAMARFSASPCSPSRTHLDLFSGIGGFALAAQVAGFTTIGFSEIEPYACKILKRHWPTVPNFGDIRNVSIRADLITGGPPCQPASCAGKQRGAEDDRWLWPEALDCVERTQPTFCLFENPTGILALNGGVEFERVLSRLESLGYSVQPIVIPACAVDARHRRDRVWIVAHAASRGTESIQQCGRGNGSEPGGEIVAHPKAVRREIRECEDGQSRSAQESEGGMDASGSRPFLAVAGHNGQRRGKTDGLRWTPEPRICRVAHGIPDRAHRLRALGNAIVPQVASEILKTLVMGND